MRVLLGEFLNKRYWNRDLLIVIVLLFCHYFDIVSHSLRKSGDL